MTVDDLKIYLRVDGTAEDALLADILTAATSYIDGQTGKTKAKTGVDASGNATYGDIAESKVHSQAVKLLCAHWYENRGVEIPGTLTKISHSVDAIVRYIACCGDFV